MKNREFVGKCYHYNRLRDTPGDCARAPPERRQDKEEHETAAAAIGDRNPARLFHCAAEEDLDQIIKPVLGILHAAQDWTRFFGKS